MNRNNNVIGGLSPTGGGIQNTGTLRAFDSTISNNNGGDFGGGIYNSGTLTLFNTTVSGNQAKTGGGIQNYFSAASAALINTTVSGNSASLGGGGGIENNGGIINLFNSTVTNNTFSGILSYSGGINNLSGTVNLRNTIVAGNIDLDINNFSPDLQGIFNGNNHNLIGNLAGATGTIGTGTDIVNPNPGLGPLQNNGGLTLTHPLLPSSPAINAGNNALIVADSYDFDGDGDTTEQIPFDQRGSGFARIFGSTVDIGAFEVQVGEKTPTISLTDSKPKVATEGVTTKQKFTVTLSEASSKVITVAYETQNGTAIAGRKGDYIGKADILTFQPGQTSQTVTITIKDDQIAGEGEEQYSVRLNNPTNATIEDGVGIGKILDNDLVTGTAIQPADLITNFDPIAGQRDELTLIPPSSQAIAAEPSQLFAAAFGTTEAFTRFTLYQEYAALAVPSELPLPQSNFI